MRLRKVICGSMAALALAVGASATSASSLTFDLNYFFSGEQADLTGSVKVVITETGITIDNLTNGQVKEVYLNYDGDLGSLVLTPPAALPTASKGSNAFKADGDGFFDILLSWGNVGDDGLAANSSITIGLSNATVAAFNSHSVEGGGEGYYYAAAHVGDYGPGNRNSGWLGQGSPGTGTEDPEPIPLPMAAWGGLVLMGIVGARRQLRASKA